MTDPETAGPEQPPALTEAEQVAATVHALQTIVNRVREAVGADTPANPPGSRQEVLPPAVLALLGEREYLSTACETAQRLEEAPRSVSAPGGAIPDVAAYAVRLHKRCRLNHKFTGQLCVCGCHGDEGGQP